MRLLSGQQFLVPCRPGATVADIKQSLAALEGGPKRCRLTLQVSRLAPLPSVDPTFGAVHRLGDSSFVPLACRALSWMIKSWWKALVCAQGSSWWVARRGVACHCSLPAAMPPPQAHTSRLPLPAIGGPPTGSI